MRALGTGHWALGIGGWALAVGAALVAARSEAAAQAKASEPASVSQTVNGAVITIAWNRPSLRGRSADSIFGAQVEWGHIWTPGANNVTTLSASRTIMLNGVAVAAGKYGVWVEVRRDSSWVLYLHPDTARWHLPSPPRSEMILSVPVQPARADGVRESLAWDFERLQATGAQLRIWWGRTIVPIAVTVESRFGTTVDAAVARRFTGAWVETLTRDSTRRRPFTIRYHEASRLLLGTGGPDEMPTHGIAEWSFVLLPRAEGVFVIGYAINNEVAQVPEQPSYIEFTIENGATTGYVRRNSQDAIVARAVRGTP